MPVNIDEAMRSAQEHYRAGHLQKAAGLYAEITRVQPDNSDALFMLGIINSQTGALNAAAEHFRKLIAVHPAHTGAYYNLGNVYRDQGQFNEAFNCYQKAIQLNPGYAEAYINIGIIFRMQGRFDEETACYQKAIQLNPRSAEAFFNLGHSFFQKEQFDKALACYEKVTLLNPQSAHAYMNLGLIFRIEGRNEEALACYRKAVQLDPEDAPAHWNLSNVLLLIGNYREGWEEFEWFRKTEDYSKRQRRFPQPLWDGSDIKGLTILLHAEEGFGDTLQFIRYAPLVAENGAKVIVESQKELTLLLKNVKGIQNVISHGSELPAFDIHCPLMSLPRVFGTTLQNIPAQIPYLFADPAKIKQWRERVQSDCHTKIGLVWSGGGLPFRKSCSLELFSPLANLQGITFYSLQKGEPGKRFKNAPAGMRLIDYADELHDFADTAAFIETLDLIIAVDTAVAHLAGALGKTVWVLLPFVPDWRWMLNREDSPWYPSMRLFRQPALGDWKGIVSMIADALQMKNKERM
jgi:tetratricopeptide (TPR) repeat protein